MTARKRIYKTGNNNNNNNKKQHKDKCNLSHFSTNRCCETLWRKIYSLEPNEKHPGCTEMTEKEFNIIIIVFITSMQVENFGQSNTPTYAAIHVEINRSATLNLTLDKCIRMINIDELCIAGIQLIGWCSSYEKRQGRIQSCNLCLHGSFDLM